MLVKKPMTGQNVGLFKDDVCNCLDNSIELQTWWENISFQSFYVEEFINPQREFHVGFL